MRKRQVLDLSVVLVFLGSGLGGAPRALATDPSHVGQWSPVLDWGFQAKHGLALHTGKILFTSGSGGFILFTPADDPVNPGTWTTIPGPVNHPFDCSGHAALPDGRILFTGGNQAHYRKTTLYDPDAGATGTWDELGNVSPALRWYPTCTTLADGTILATAGHSLSTGDSPNTPAIFDPSKPAGSQWISLPNAEYCDAQLITRSTMG